jgi:hypothetical protein
MVIGKHHHRDTKDTEVLRVLCVSVVAFFSGDREPPKLTRYLLVKSFSNS